MGSLQNISRIRKITFLSWLFLHIPILYPFFMLQGFSPEQYFLWNASFSLFMGLLEIPSGYFADRLGRVKAVKIGTFLAILPLVCYPFVTDFWLAMSLNFISAMSFALSSGADVAIVYDSLLEADQEKNFMKEKSFLDSISSFAESGGAIFVSLLLIYGVVAEVDLRWIIWLSAGVAILNFLQTLRLVEPKAHNEKFDKSGWKDIFGAVKTTFGRGSNLKWLILANTVFGVTTLTSTWLAQPFFLEHDVGIKYFGLLWAFLQLPVGLAALLTPFLEKYFGTKMIPLFLSALILIAFNFLGFGGMVLGICGFVLLGLMRGVNRTHFSTLINHAIRPKLRATVLSLNSMMFRLSYMFFGSISGVLIGGLSLSWAFIILGSVFGFMGLLFYLKLRTLNYVAP